VDESIEKLRKEIELEAKGYRKYQNTPQRIMMKRWDECGRDVHKYWNSIPWDGEWLKHDTPEEKKVKDIEREFNRHPFKEFIKKDSKLLI
tara:strand:+ start:519 stop:788 length:270 start_codon:yes stop_codon:yes gene_type:complete